MNTIDRKLCDINKFSKKKIRSIHNFIYIIDIALSTDIDKNNVDNFKRYANVTHPPRPVGIAFHFGKYKVIRFEFYFVRHILFFSYK